MFWCCFEGCILFDVVYYIIYIFVFIEIVGCDVVLYIGRLGEFGLVCDVCKISFGILVDVDFYEFIYYD